MLRKVYPGRQVECNNSSQHKIDEKIKEVNDDNEETQKEEDNITQDDRKIENETQDCDFIIHEHNRNDEDHEQNKEGTETEKKEKCRTRK